MKKQIIIGIVVVIIIALGVYYFINSSKSVVVNLDQNVATSTATTTTTTSTSTVNKVETIIGKSVEGRDITAYHYGTGSSEVLLVTGVHGGYSWNTVLLGYQTMDYLKANPNIIPANMKVTIIPVLNPDGLNKVVGSAGRFNASDVPASLNETIAGRFNADNVDLNRNFDCDWQTTGSWQSRTVSGGETVFSEPETLALKNYIEANKPKAVVAYYSAAGGVFSSNCHAGILPETSAITKAYSKASGYTAYEDFDFYETTGDMTNWLAKINIPAISVLLTNHTSVEWTKNLAGIESLLKYYSK